jgi:hypothetical protein
MRDGKPVLVRLPELNFNDDKADKPVGINQHIGRRPIAAFGNSAGDQEMLEYTQGGSGARFELLVLHDDAAREYAYGPAQGLPDVKLGAFTQAVYDEAKRRLDRGQHEGRLETGLPDFKYDARCAVFAPTGEYDQNQLANVGLGYWTFSPEVTFSWLSSKIGTEVSLFAGLDFNTKNTDADYQSGDLFHLDATVAQHLPLFGGFAGVGANGFYIKQITGDSGSGARLGGFEAETYGVGPVLSYAHKLGKHDLVCEVKWLPQLDSKNTTKGDYVWVKLALIF